MQFSIKKDKDKICISLDDNFEGEFSINIEKSQKIQKEESPKITPEKTEPKIPAPRIEQKSSIPSPPPIPAQNETTKKQTTGRSYNTVVDELRHKFFKNLPIVKNTRQHDAPISEKEHKIRDIITKEFCHKRGIEMREIYVFDIENEAKFKTFYDYLKTKNIKYDDFIADIIKFNLSNKSSTKL